LRVPVLFHGETGTGLDHVARCLVDLQSGGRSFSYASARAPRQSDVGRTVYLDKVDEFAEADQELWFQQIHSSESSSEGAPYRVLASTNADLMSAASFGSFHPELARSLSRFRVTLAPLRYRLEDIDELVRVIGGRISRKIGRSNFVLTRSSVRSLRCQFWPGNVRELSETIERLLAFSEEGRITRRDVTLVLQEKESKLISARTTVERAQRDELIRHLQATGGNLAEVGRRIGMSRGAIIYRAQKFGLMPQRARGRPVSRRS